MQRFGLALALVVCTSLAALAASPDEAAGGQAKVEFMRFVDRGPSSSSLDAAQVTYRNGDGVTVRLVSAVHIGEKAYYDALSRDFRKDDAVLYEMVKQAGAPVERIRESDNAVSKLQRLLRDKLGLEFQLEAIDYTPRNFVHADLDYETFSRMQSERNESMASIMLQAMMDSLSHPTAGSSTGDGVGDLLTLIALPDPERQLRRQLAVQMGDIEARAMGLDGPNGSVILTERNKACIRVLDREIGKGKKTLSIFYGAAHMPDLSRRLQAMGFAPVETTWVQAWDVSIRPTQPSALVRWFGAATQPTTAPAPQPAKP